MQATRRQGVQVILRRLAMGGFLAIGLALAAAGVAVVLRDLLASGVLAAATLPLAGALVTLGLLLTTAALLWFDERRWIDVLIMSLGVAIISAAGIGSWWLAPGTLPLIDADTARVSGAVALALPAVFTILCALLARILRPREHHAGITGFYEHAVKSRRVRRDAAQQAVVARLEQLSIEVMAFERARRLPWGFLHRPPRGIYLWGPVGRGKSFLMDGFFDVLPSANKRRYHFHELMADIRRELHAATGKRNPMRRIATAIAPRGAVVFIDEVQINDIDSASVFGELLRQFTRHRNTVCLTSNQPPQALFGTGSVARDRFAATLTLLQRNLEVMALDRGQDYRELKLTAHDLYQCPVSESTDADMQRVFDMLIEGPVSTEPITVGQRRLRPRAHGAGVAWFDFDEICRAPRSYVDFLELVRRYPNLMISDVPAFTEDDEDAARRFGWLVELIYDHRKRLIVSARARPGQLFPARLSSHGDAADFGKIASRLLEMQSSEYDYSLASEAA